MTPIDFQVTWSKVKVKLLVFEKNVVRSISLDSFDGKFLVQWMLLASTAHDPYQCSGHRVKGHDQGLSLYLQFSVQWMPIESAVSY